MQGSLQVHPTDLLQRRIHLGDIVAFIEVWNKHARAKGGKSSRHLHAAVSYMVSRAQWGSAWGGSQSSNAAANPFEVTSPPSDGVTSLSFSPSAGASLLLASSWDSQQQVRIWEIGQRATVPKAATSLQQPVLCAAWSPDGTAVFAGGCDETVQLWNLHTNQLQQVALHRKAVRHLAYIQEVDLLVTASWDKTLQYWDIRQRQAVNSLNLPERAYAFSLQYPLLVLGLADRHIQVYNLKHPSQAFKQTFSPLKFQTRCVACFPDQKGFALGSVEGRVACQWLEQGPARNFSFKCHRDQRGIHAVNDISFHPKFGTFATAGSDGTISFWDKDAKQRLKALPNVGQTISCATFSTDGSLYACAASYDWSRGMRGHSPQQKIILHPITQSDVQPKQQASQHGR